MEDEEGDGNICMKIHNADGHRLLAACDKELLGNEYKENELRLKVSKSFFYDEYVDKETLLRFLKTVDMANLVGEDVVSTAIEGGFIEEECVLRIQNIPHAQFCSV